MSCNNIHILALQHAGGVLGDKTLVPRFLVSSRTFLHCSIVPLLMNFSSTSLRNGMTSSSADDEASLASISNKSSSASSFSSSSSSPSSSGDNFFLRADQSKLLALFSESSTLQFASKFTFDACDPEFIEWIFVRRLVKESYYAARSVASLRLSAISGEIVEAMGMLPALKVLDLGGCNKLYDRTLMNMGHVFAVGNGSKNGSNTPPPSSTSPNVRKKGQISSDNNNNNNTNNTITPTTSPAISNNNTVDEEISNKENVNKNDDDKENPNQVEKQQMLPESFPIARRSPYPPPRLTKLNLANNNMISANGFKWIGTFAPYLCYLNLSYCIKVDSHCMKCLYNSNDNNNNGSNNVFLRELNLNCTSVTSLGFIVHLRNLFKIELASCSKLVGDDLKYFGLFSRNFTPKNGEVDGEHDEDSQNPLHELNLSSNRHLNDDDLHHLQDPLPYLRALNISYCTRLTDTVIERTLSKATFADSLRVLNIAGLPKIHDRGFGFLSALSSLQVLNVSNSETLTNLKFVRSMIELRVLNCSGCENLVDISALEELSSSTLTYYHHGGSSSNNQVRPSCALKVLSLSNCVSLPDDQLKFLSRLCVTSLQRLDLSMSTRFSNYGMQFLSHEVGEDKDDHIHRRYNDCSLKELFLSNCRRVSDLTFAVLMRNLEVLGISGCPVTRKNIFHDMFPLIKLV